MGQYLPVMCLLVLASLFGALSFFASRLLAPRRPSSAEVRELTARAQAALERLVDDFPEGRRPGPIGRWVTEIFNDWPDGSRPPAVRRDAGSRD